jgi:hypothetical protein
VCFDRIDKPIEGLRCCVGGHQRCWHSIGKDGQIAGQSPPPRDEGQSPPARQGSPCARGCGTRPVHALSTRTTIGKEHRSVMPTCPTTGFLTPRKVTIRRQLVVPSSSSDDDLPLMSDSPPLSLPPYIVLGQRVGVRYDKVLIPNPAYKGMGRAESASLNPTPRVQRRPPPPNICGCWRS